MGNSTPKPQLKRWWFTLLVLIVLVGIVGCVPPQSTVVSTTSIDPLQTARQANLPREKIDVTINAEELAKAFEDNQEKATKLYTGKRAEITGVISSMGDVLGQVFITFMPHSDYATSQVQCFFTNPEEIKRVFDTKLIIGKEITIIGKIGEKTINIRVEDCKLK